jgi:hypothetical protein
MVELQIFVREIWEEDFEGKPDLKMVFPHPAASFSCSSSTEEQKLTNTIQPKK